MRRRLVPFALALLAGVVTAQNAYNYIWTCKPLDGYVYPISVNTTTHQAEHIQGFPRSLFDGIGKLHGVYANLYDENPSTPERYWIIIRKSDASGKRPDMLAPVLHRQSGMTTPGGTTAGWVPIWASFTTPIVPPPGTLWVSVMTDMWRNPTDYLRLAALNKHGVGTSCFGVEPRPGVTNDYAYYCRHNNGVPGFLAQTDYAWVWDIALMLKRPVLQAYSVCQVNRGVMPPYIAKMGTKDYSSGGLWPDLVNATKYTPGRYDDIGWRIQQAIRGPGNTLWGFLFLSDRKLAAPLATPYGDWTLFAGGPLWPLGSLFSPLVNGQWETAPIPIPTPVRTYLLGTSIYAQAAVAELDTQLKIIKVELSTMAGIHP